MLRSPRIYCTQLTLIFPDRPCRNCALSSTLCVFPSNSPLSYPSQNSSARDPEAITPAYRLAKRQAEDDLHSPTAKALFLSADNQHVARGRGEYLGDPSYQLFAETIIAHIEFRESSIRMQNRVTTIIDSHRGRHPALSRLTSATQVSPHVFEIKRKYNYVRIAPVSCSSQTTLKLPPKDYTMRLLTVMEKQNDFLGYCLFGRSLWQRIIDMYNFPHKPENKDRTWLSKLLSLVAIGELNGSEAYHGFNSARHPDTWKGSNSSDQSKGAEPPGLEYFRTAVGLLPKMDEEPTLEYIEVLCLFAYYSHSLNRQNEAYSHIGLALRTSLIMGIHQSPSRKPIFQYSGAKPSTTGLERERVNRLWWTVYIMNQYGIAASPVHTIGTDPLLWQAPQLQSRPPSGDIGF